MSEKIEIKDLLQYKFIENLQYNPSGTIIAYQLAYSDVEHNTYKRDIWVIENNVVRQLTSTIDARIVAWLNDSELLLSRSTEDTKPMTTDLYKINIYGGEAMLYMTLPFVLNTLKVVNDTCFVASSTIDMHNPDTYLMNAEEKKKYVEDTKKEDENYQVLDEIPYWFNGSHFINSKREALFVIQTNSFLVTRITEPAFDTSEFIIDKKQIIYVGTNRNARESLYNQVFVYDIDTKQTTPLYEPLNYSISTPFVLDDTLFIKASDMKEYGVNETSKICKLENQQVTPIFKPEVSLYSSLALDTALAGGKNNVVKSDCWYTLATEDYETVIYAYTKTFDKQVIKPEGYSISSFDCNDKRITFIAHRNDALQEIYTMNLDGTNIQQRTQHNAKALENKYIALVKRLTYTSEGEALNGWVLLPKDYDATKKYPAILDIHGGPRAAYGEAFFHEMQVWASLGYFVMYTNIRGSDGRGDAFADIRGKYGSVDYKNLMDFVDTVLEKYPAIDRSKLCETGGSYGGFMTNWIIGHTDRFCCAASQRSISNWISKSFLSDIGPYFNPDQCGAKDAFDFEKLWEHSPLKYAANVKTPTLFIHSDEDHRCPLEEGMQMMQALIMKGVPTRMCLFHHETHELSRSGKPEHRIRRLEEITNWFNKYTK